MANRRLRRWQTAFLLRPLRNRRIPNGQRTSRFALCVGGRILGIVEAKKLTLGPQNVLTQAERYSRGTSANPLSFHGYRVPFLYSTNGEVIWHHDIRDHLDRSHTLAAFHTPEALEEKLSRDFNAACEVLLQTNNDHPRLRPYQREANSAIEKALCDRKRQMLIAMATGTGKTFTMVNEIYRLMKSGVAKRILFLCRPSRARCTGHTCLCVLRARTWPQIRPNL